jgi:quercetin dioxygenase-like cupin family protein
MTCLPPGAARTWREQRKSTGVRGLEAERLPLAQLAVIVPTCTESRTGEGDERMKPTALSLLLLLASASAIPAFADGYPAISLYSGSKTVTGEEIAYPTEGKAHVNAMIVTLGPGEKTILHQHGVPVFIHILEGEVTVDYGDLGQKTFKQGESFLEAMKFTHAGRNTGSIPVRILAVYMGAKGARDVIPVK